MANNTQTYAFGGVAASIDNLLVEDFWEGDDVVMVEYNTDVSNLLVGADGSATLNVSSDNSATITLKLKEFSAAHRFLKERQALARQGVVRPFRFSLTNTNNGETGNGENCFVGTQPATSYGSNATVREWKILCPCWIENQVN